MIDDQALALIAKIQEAKERVAKADRQTALWQDEKKAAGIAVNALWEELHDLMKPKAELEEID